ncbi:MAG: lytic murein transglycosylase B, partial [Gammaproteobacteria bacterium]|nr:lytic murein transglycosylase B [Gammaproteobacteria bacterium]
MNRSLWLVLVLTSVHAVAQTPLAPPVAAPPASAPAANTTAASPPAASPPAANAPAANTPAARAIPGSAVAGPPAAGPPVSAPPAPALTTPPAPAAPAPFDLKRPEIATFVDEVVRRDGLSRWQVKRLLRKAQPQPKILDIMTRPLEKVSPWWEYREHFLTEERISDGVQFWNEHLGALESVAAEYHVPPEYVVAILGVETKYGRNTGGYRALDALATLAFDYPPRQKFFRGELKEFLILVKENRFDALAIKGSYAGALGVPQFMPSTYRRYAVAGSAHKRRDLWGDWHEIIASVANYLRQYGWTPGAPVLAETRLDPEPNFQIEPRNLELNETAESLGARGVHVAAEVPLDTPVMLLSAEQRDGPAYRVGFH